MSTFVGTRMSSTSLTLEHARDALTQFAGSKPVGDIVLSEAINVPFFSPFKQTPALLLEAQISLLESQPARLADVLRRNTDFFTEQGVKGAFERQLKPKLGSYTDFLQQYPPLTTQQVQVIQEDLSVLSPTLNSNPARHLYQFEIAHQEQVFRGSPHAKVSDDSTYVATHTSCGYMSCYGANVLWELLSKNPGASHEEIAQALKNGKPDRFVRESTRLLTEPELTGLKHHGGHRDPAEGKLSLENMVSILTQLTPKIVDDLAISDGNLTTEGHKVDHSPPGIRVVFKGEEETGDWRQGDFASIAQLISEVKARTRPVAVLILPDELPKVSHYVTVALRMNKQGELETLFVDGMNSQKPEWLMKGQPQPSATLAWLQNTFISPSEKVGCALTTAPLNPLLRESVPVVVPGGATGTLLVGLVALEAQGKAVKLNRETGLRPSFTTFGEPVNQAFFALLAQHAGPQATPEALMRFSLASALAVSKETFDNLKKQFYPGYDVGPNTTLFRDVERLARQIVDAQDPSKAIKPELAQTLGACEASGIVDGLTTRIVPDSTSPEQCLGYLLHHHALRLDDVVKNFPSLTSLENPVMTFVDTLGSPLPSGLQGLGGLAKQLQELRQDELRALTDSLLKAQNELGELIVKAGFKEVGELVAKGGLAQVPSPQRKQLRLHRTVGHVLNAFVVQQARITELGEQITKLGAFVEKAATSGQGQAPTEVRETEAQASALLGLELLRRGCGALTSALERVPDAGDVLELTDVLVFRGAQLGDVIQLLGKDRSTVATRLDLPGTSSWKEIFAQLEIATRGRSLEQARESVARAL